MSEALPSAGARDKRDHPREVSMMGDSAHEDPPVIRIPSANRGTNSLARIPNQTS